MKAVGRALVTKLLWLVLIAGVCLLPSLPAHAVVPAAGTEIRSQSRAEYQIDSDSFVIFSNEVTTRVLPLYAVDLSPDGSTASPAYSLAGYAGDTLYADFILANLANTRDSLVVAHGPAESGFAPAAVVIFHDANGNGIFDAGENDPAVLALELGGSVEMMVGVVLPAAAAGTTHWEISAHSATDETAADASVIRIELLQQEESDLFIGPEGNPKALPGGEESADDMTVLAPSLRQTSITFTNQILSEGGTEDEIEISLGDNHLVPDGVTVTFSDSLGGDLPRASGGNGRFLLGRIDPDEPQRVQVRITTAGEPLYFALGRSLAVPVQVRSLIDSTRRNTTIDIIDLDGIEPPLPLISLQQTFRQQVVSTGDLVSLIVTVKNISDSVAVDSVVVREMAQPSLEFVSSPAFVLENGRLVWHAGSLAAGEERVTVIKFICNGRVSRGKVKTVGAASGVSEFGIPAYAGPVITVLGIENDLFSADGFVLGDVFIDADRDGVRGTGEEGIPGAAVYLESGAYAITDSSGQFSIPQTYAGYRIVRLDESSLPRWVDVPSAGETDDHGHRWHTRMVHLLESGHARVSFPLQRRPEIVPVSYASRSIACQEKVSFTKMNSVIFQTKTLSSSYFETGKAFLKPAAINELLPLARFLTAHPFWCVFIEGHTDSVPIHTARFPSNYELSLARAQAVQRFFEAQGVEALRVVTRGYGERRPAASNATAAGRSLNRRVEVSLVPPGIALENIGALTKIRTEINALAALSDSLQSTVLWRLTTDSPDPLNTRLTIRIPEAIAGGSTTVRYEGRTIEERDGTYAIPGFQKSNGIDIEVVCPIAGRDTLLVRDIAAAIEIDSIAVAAPDSAGGAKETAAMIHPLRQGGTTREASMYELLNWRVVDDAPSVPPLSGPVIAGTGDGAAAADSLPCNIVTPETGRVFSKRDRITVHVRVPLGSKTVLRCNGEVVPEHLIGQKVIELRKRSEGLFWYGAKLRTGWNRIDVTATGVDGTVWTDSIRVALAGKPVALQCERDRVTVPADGRTRTRVRFAMRDQLGLPVVDGLVATVITGDSLVTNRDERPDMRGLQVTSSDGHFTLTLAGSNLTGRKNVRLRYEQLEAGCPVAYVPPERTFFIAGVVDSKVNFMNATGSGSPLGLEEFDDGLSTNGASRVFVQGTGYGGLNFTMRLDSKKRYEDPLLKTLNPEREYPIYGDASELHYAAPSRGGNYLAVEKGESFASYGDFRTPLTDGEFLTYKRAATGVNAKLTRGDRTFKGFITESDYTTIRDELPGDGTSGYYYLTQSPVVEFSEKIVLETRDRYQPERILSVQPLIQNRDYTINYLDGSLLFKQPVPVSDLRFNPVMIVVIYEVSGRDTGQEKRFLYGLTGNILKNGKKRLQVSAVARDGEGKGYTLYGVSGGTSFKKLELNGELARSEDEIAGTGNAFKVEAQMRRERIEGSLYLRRVDGDFLNPSFSGSAHELASLKAGYESRVKIVETLSLKSLGYQQRFYRTGERRENIDALMEYAAGSVTAVAGVRAATLERDRRANHGVLGIFGAGYERSAAKIETRWEQNMGDESVDDYPNRIRTISTIDFLKRYRLVLNHEYLGPSSRAATHQAQVGVESRLGSSGSAYTRYAMNRTASDERLGAIAGFKQSLTLSQRLRGTFAVENYHSLSGDKNEDYFALKTGINSVQKQSYLIESQYELRWQKRATKHLFRTNALKELKPGMSLLFREAFSYFTNHDRDDAVSFKGRVALAYRPADAALQNLLMIKTMYERFTPVNPEAVTWKLVCSTDLNYRPRDAYEFRLKYAMKYVEDYFMNESLDARSQLVLSQFIYRFGKRWDVDLWGRMLHHSSGSSGVGSGVELGMMLFQCVRVAAGYSVNGFEEPDMAERDAWVNGFGVRVQLLLSEWILNEAGL